jgi:hypothetical protein
MRTPKTFEHSSWWQVIKANRAESILAACGAVGIAAGLSHTGTLSGPLLAALLFFPTLGFAAAPFNSLAAQRAALPPDLRHRRRTEFLRQPTVVRGAVAASGVAVVAAVTAGVLALLTAAPAATKVQSPVLVAPAPAQSSTNSGGASSTAPSAAPTSSAATPTPTSTATPSPSPSPSGSTTPTTSPTPTPSGTSSPPPTASPTASPSASSSAGASVSSTAIG